MSALLDRFLNEAPTPLKRRFVFACADRAVREYTVEHLRNAEFWEQAKKLEGLAPVTNYETAAEARDAASAAVKATQKRGDISAGYANRAAINAANIAGNATEAAIGLSAEVSRLTRSVSITTASAFSGERGGAYVERRAQDLWIRTHWKPLPTKEDLTDLDAYIADGLLLGDDE